MDNNNINGTCISGNLKNDISDHLPNTIIYGENNTSKLYHNRKFVRIYSEKNIENFKKYLNNTTLWEGFETLNDCNQAYDKYIKIVNDGFNVNFPLTRLSNSRAKDKKWITLAIRKSCSTKNKLYKRYLKKPTENNHRKYKRYRNLLNKVCMKAQTSYYQELLLNTKNSVKKLWQTFGPIINPTKIRIKEVK